MTRVSGFVHAFTVGVEEELLLVDPDDLRLRNVAVDVLARLDLPDGRAGHEAYASEVELRSDRCRDVGDAIAQVREARAAVRATGCALIGSGLHPTAPWGAAELVATPRYARVEDDMRGLIRRAPECALHVHVGMPDAATAVRAFNALRVFMPLLQALAGNSPYWFGADSGLASARWAMVRAYPGRGIPAPLRDWEEWEERMDAARLAGGFADYTHVWWDVRLHPRLGTLEVRELDAQAPLEDTAAVAALVHVLARHCAEAPVERLPPTDAIGWSAFRAARDGVRAEVLDGAGGVRPVTDVARQLVRDLAPVARELGADGALEGVARLLERGGGAGRQRAAGGPEQACRALAEATA